MKLVIGLAEKFSVVMKQYAEQQGLPLKTLHIVFKTWIGQRLSDPRAIHAFTYT